jgi:taurine dioxygenase
LQLTLRAAALRRDAIFRRRPMEDRMKITPHGNGRPGARVTEIDARDLTPADVHPLKVAMAEHAVLVFRDQALDAEDFMALGEKFDPLQCSIQDQWFHPQHPEILMLSNIVENGKTIGIADTNAGLWHTDHSYMVRPTGYTFLYAVETPPVGSDTQFVSTRHMYDQLSHAEKEKFDNIQITYSSAKLTETVYETHKEETGLATKVRMTEEQKQKFPEVTHPLVRTHPIDGKTGLYFGAYQSAHIKSMKREEGEALVKDLVTRATRPENVYTHKWQPGDLVVWDNRGSLHAASDYDRERHRRLVWRITTESEPPYRTR